MGGDHLVVLGLAVRSRFGFPASSAGTYASRLERDGRADGDFKVWNT